MIPIYIPYVNRPDLLARAIASIPKLPDVRVWVINNSGAPLKSDKHNTFTPEHPLTFSKTQNLMMKMASYDPFYLFMHSDAEAGPATIQRLIAIANLEARNWGAIFTNYDALAAFKTSAFKAISGWDEEFVWYASDQDVYRRLRLAGYELLDSNLPVYHEPSQTLKADPSIAQAVAKGFEERTRRYREKWGGEAGHEAFTVPWGGELGTTAK